MLFTQTFRAIASRSSLRACLQNNYATKSIFVGNIPWQTTKEELAEHFRTKVNVDSVHLPLDPLGRTKGFAFVEVDEADCEKTMEAFNETEFNGRQIHTSLANSPKPSR